MRTSNLPAKASLRREKRQTNVGYVASYARFAIRIRNFSPELERILQCTRNKIARVGSGALRLLPVFPCKLQSPGLEPRVEEP